jgi:hypothetical protein
VRLPPTSIDSVQLFRLLSEPHPSWPIEFRFKAAPDVALEARAVHRRSWRQAEASRSWLPVVVASLYSGGSPVFSGVTDAGMLEQAEFASLADGVLSALSIVGPVSGQIDWPAWERVVCDGARRCGYESEQVAMSSDVAVGFAGLVRSPRPDRYWGVPLSELLDGHWLTYWACRKVHD